MRALAWRASLAPPLEFPHVGEVFAFRQVQGTGAIGFKYASLDAAQSRGDYYAAAALIALVAALTYVAGFFFSTWRRAAVTFALACLVAILAGTALDLAFPGLIAAVALLFGFRRSAAAPETGSSAH